MNTDKSSLRTTSTEVTVDLVIETEKEEVLLIKRKNPPFKGKWALPGGFVDVTEKILTAAVRELREETNLQVSESHLSFIGFFDQPDRDPRGRLISFAYGTKVSSGETIQAGDDAEEAGYFPITNLPELAFDHLSILKAWLKSRKDGTANV